MSDAPDGGRADPTPQIAAAHREIDALVQQARAQAGREVGFHEAREVFRAARNEAGYSSYHHAQYNVGATYAVMGDKARAVEWLRKAAAEGFPCYPYYASDPNLSALKGDPVFESFMAGLQKDWERRRATL